MPQATFLTKKINYVKMSNKYIIHWYKTTYDIGMV